MLAARLLDLREPGRAVVGNLVPLSRLDPQHAGQVPRLVTAQVRDAAANGIDEKSPPGQIPFDYIGAAANDLLPLF